jgi:hypothetical protein
LWNGPVPDAAITAVPPPSRATTTARLATRLGLMSNPFPPARRVRDLPLEAGAVTRSLIRSSSSALALALCSRSHPTTGSSSRGVDSSSGRLIAPLYEPAGRFLTDHH